MAEKERDWVPAVAVGVGAVGIGAGIYLFTRKPKGVDPGDTLLARFVFNYRGEGGTFIIQVSLGNILLGGWFDHIDGLTWTREIALPESGAYEEDLECPLPAALTAQKFDAEATIRSTGMDWLDYIVKVVAKDAVEVRK